MAVVSLDLFANEEKWRIRNWQIVTDTLIVIVETQRQIFHGGFETTFVLVQSTK